MRNQVRSYIEVAGAWALIASLLFVGLELKINSDINMVQLHYNRMSLYQDRFTAMLESETYIQMHAKRNLLDWDSGDFTPYEMAAAEVSAYNMLVKWEYEYRLAEITGTEYMNDHFA